MKLPTMPKIQELIRMYGLTAKQQLSQNFLLDLNVTDKICKLAGGFNDCTVIEVGAGPGGLTRSLLTSGAKKVIAVEMDNRFIPALKMLEEASEGRLSVVMGDMMRVDERAILERFGVEPVKNWEDPAKVKIIGNLPFNVGTHLMLKWIRQIKPREGLYHFGRVPMILMFQKELSDRIAAPINSAEYGRLAVMVGQECSSKIIYNVPGKVFVPPPKVDASVIMIEPLVKPIGDLKSKEHLEYICRELFNQKRKTIVNSIKSLGEGSHILIGDIDPNKRAQNLTIPEFVDISNRYTDWPNKVVIDELEFKNEGLTVRDKLKKEKREKKRLEQQERDKQEDLAFSRLDNKGKKAYIKKLQHEIDKRTNISEQFDKYQNEQEIKQIKLKQEMKTGLTKDEELEIEKRMDELIMNPSKKNTTIEEYEDDENDQEDDELEEELMYLMGQEEEDQIKTK